MMITKGHDVRTREARRTRRRRAPQGPRLRGHVQPIDEPLGELRPRLHLPLAARGRLLALRARPHGRRSALDLVDRHRRRGPAARLARLRRGRVAVPDPRRHLPVGAAPLGPPLRLDGGLGLHLGDDRHDHRRRRVRLGLRGQPVRRRATPPTRPCWLTLGLLRDRPRHQPHRHEVARPRRAHRPGGRAHRRHRPRALPADLPAPAGLRHLLRHDGRRGRRAATSPPSSVRPSPACSSSTASRPAATSPRRSRTRRGASPRR